MEETYKNWVLYFIVCFIIWFWVRTKPPLEVSATIGFLTAWTAIFAVGELFVWISRYELPKVVTDSFNGSIYENPDKIGQFGVFNTGYSLYPVPMRGKLATLVIPLSQLRKYGGNFMSRCRVKKTPLNCLPPDVCRYLKRNDGRYNIKNIYFGDYSEKFSFENEIIPEMKEVTEDLNRQINEAREVIEGKNDMLVDEINKSRKLSDTENVLQKLLNAVKKKKEDTE